MNGSREVKVLRWSLPVESFRQMVMHSTILWLHHTGETVAITPPFVFLLLLFFFFIWLKNMPNIYLFYNFIWRFIMKQGYSVLTAKKHFPKSLILRWASINVSLSFRLGIVIRLICRSFNWMDHISCFCHVDIYHKGMCLHLCAWKRSFNAV